MVSIINATVKIGVSNLTELHVAECHAPATQT